ncbi:hypothetical protein [Metabacillus bambusae]|uniref:N-acetyltransferase domain-containing protein n=1 Tax=Metabacillus bambusae TaxID=2795218 RepID=A0ABS3NA10_9BACI|nr:hypothetical protein [Metabacillus bambusae]MBO1515023.1 hypothetical protein [Metabacillus bambusae]
MYHKVSSEIDKEIFNKLWGEACIEKGFELESTSSHSALFLIYNKEKSPIGTVELIPYENVENNAEKVFPFSSLDMIKQNPTEVFEIDKVSLLKKYRGSNLKKILNIIYSYAVDNDYTYGITLLEPLFYRSLKTFYKIPIKRVTKEKIFYKGDYVIPSIIDFGIVKSNVKDYKWFLKINENDLAIMK